MAHQTRQIHRLIRREARMNETSNELEKKKGNRSWAIFLYFVGAGFIPARDSSEIWE
jgi:hypothetical protein